MDNSKYIDKLMAYLYGELSPEEEAKFKAEIDTNPALQKELKELQETHNLLGNLSDEKATLPLFFGEAPRSKAVKNNYSRLMVAASITLGLLLILWFIPIEMRYESQGLSIRFGKSVEQKQASPNNEKGTDKNTPSRMEVYQMMEQFINKKQDSLLVKIDSLEQQLQQQNEMMPTTPMVVQQVASLSEADKASLLKQLRAESLEDMMTLIELSNEKQKAYAEQLLTAYAQYDEEKRNQDLTNIGLSFNNLQANNANTDRLLSKVIQTVNYRENE